MPRFVLYLTAIAFRSGATPAQGQVDTSLDPGQVCPAKGPHGARQAISRGSDRPETKWRARHTSCFFTRIVIRTPGHQSLSAMLRDDWTNRILR
jgi:hypothetical protein